jgi:hypothetical protein
MPTSILMFRQHRTRTRSIRIRLPSCKTIPTQLLQTNCITRRTRFPPQSTPLISVSKFFAPSQADLVQRFHLFFATVLLFVVCFGEFDDHVHSFAFAFAGNDLFFFFGEAAVGW